MPRLFDLLPDSSRKELLAEARKARPSKHGGRHGTGASDPTGAPKAARPFVVPDFVALDVETTGLEYKADRIIEIGAVRFLKGRPDAEFSTFVNPGIPIPSHITDLTGIADTDVEGAPAFSEISGKLVEFIGQLPLCGHQIEFDATFINEELKRIGVATLQPSLLDTALLSRIVLQPLQYFSLKSVSDSLDVNLSKAHRALHDARASGEVAALLLPRISGIPLPVRQTMAACAPGSYFKSLLIQSLGNSRPMLMPGRQRQALSVPKLGTPDVVEPLDRDTVAEAFSAGGALSRSLEGFVPRPSQLDMALSVADAFCDQKLLIAEAGTGTGKSLAYLVPAALWALRNNTRVLVSTRTLNLQDQLASNDLPLVKKIVGDKLLYTVLKGRSNYLCRNRWMRLLAGELGNLSPRERTALLPLIVWSETTLTGDIEEQNQFNPKWFTKIWNLISADGHDCRGRRCADFQTCFLQQARQRALGSHIVVINHSLFFSEVSAETSFLGKLGAVIFDEAHHLESSGHRHLRTELDTNRVNLFIDTINNLVQSIGELKDEIEVYTNGKELRSVLKQLRKRSGELLEALGRWAARELPSATREFQIAYRNDPFASCVEASSFGTIIEALGDTLYHLKQAIVGSPNAEKFGELLDDVQGATERASQLKADYQYLALGSTDDHVFWIEGNHEKGWVKLCGVPLDVSGILSTIWELCSGPVVFTSATLSVSGSAEYFSHAVGLETHQKRTTVGIFKSPFSRDQAVMCAIRNSPEPDSPQYPEYVASVLGRIHTELGRNVLALFTSNSMLGSVYELLKRNPAIEKGHLLAQGMSGARHVILEQFKRASRSILLGTDSFWEGIDVPGEACEIVVIPRLPFPVPTHPLTQAIAKKKEETNGESFFSYAVPEAVIKFRQGVGRLIRTTTDRGALMVLDSRIVSKGYGRQFTRSVDGDFCAFESVDQAIERVREFFVREPGEQNHETRYVPIEEV